MGRADLYTGRFFGRVELWSNSTGNGHEQGWGELPRPVNRLRLAEKARASLLAAKDPTALEAVLGMESRGSLEQAFSRQGRETLAAVRARVGDDPATVLSGLQEAVRVMTDQELADSMAFGTERWRNEEDALAGGTDYDFEPDDDWGERT